LGFGLLNFGLGMYNGYVFHFTNTTKVGLKRQLNLKSFSGKKNYDLFFFWIKV